MRVLLVGRGVGEAVTAGGGAGGCPGVRGSDWIRYKFGVRTCGGVLDGVVVLLFGMVMNHQT